MGIHEKLAAQTITYWAPAGTRDAYGNQTFASPALIGGFWMDKQELFVDAEGREVRSTAVVFVDQDCELGGYLAEGDQTATANPVSVDGAREIRGWEKIPHLRQIEAKTTRKALL
jgi:hypothetical protein